MITSKQLETIKSGLEETLFSWNSQVGNALQSAKIDISKYEGVFSDQYILSEDVANVAKDICKIESLIENKKDVCYDASVVFSHTGDSILRLYSKNSDHNLHDYSILLGNFGVDISAENHYEINICGQKCAIYVFAIALEPKDSLLALKNDERVQKNFELVLTEVLDHKMRGSILNRLAITANLTFRETILLRAIVKYFKQAGFVYSDSVVEKTISKNSQFAILFIEYFKTKFDPSILLSTDERLKKLSQIDFQIKEKCHNVTSEVDDKVLKAIFTFLCSILRTNYFLNKEEISFKIDSQKVGFLPIPVPYREIFVYATHFEAIHLRFGTVARGGLRWSDRIDDFRTEVLSLVKAQNTKNAVIVPVGAKGGFVIKRNVSHLSRDEQFEFGKLCYTGFLSACLDITDNVLNAKPQTPANIVKYDDFDPYFVVAADKGTATFSDLANSISAKYNFWFGDAFASGGSNGYDHKKMGITAKGAWIAARRHFMELGHDIQNKEFTCIGIGDLSGDVFGNGMLLSKKTKLVAAFNHMHIFLDPNPDVKASYTERERMFALPRSSWMDYDKSKMSKGSAIFERSQKECILSDEIKNLLDVKDDVLSPNELIKAILKASCDMLYNGGIGTYVKASYEKHSDAGDKANNDIRIDGNDLRVKVVVEGGNVGFTQNGRVEFALKGGKINTDAMDNSAGVDCSDHEVNIKLILNELSSCGKISLEDRNNLLANMTDEIEELVLRDNYEQTQAISVTAEAKESRLDNQEKLMQKLENLGILNRENEFLPSTQQMLARKLEKRPLTRPELCVLFAYSKIYLYRELLETKLLDEAYFEKDLLSYFPKQMQEKFANEIKNHKLRREIIATSVNNSVINRIGITFVNNTADELGCQICDIVRAFIVVREVFALDDIWKKIESLDYKVPSSQQLQLFHSINKFIESAVYIFLRILPFPISISDCIPVFKQKVLEILECIVIKEDSLEIEKDDLYFINQKVLQFFEVLRVIKYTSTKNLKEAISTHYKVEDVLKISQIQKMISSFFPQNYYSRVAYKALCDKFSDSYVNVVLHVLEKHKNVLDWQDFNKDRIASFLCFVSEVKLLDNIDFAVLSIVVDRFAMLLKK